MTIDDRYREPNGCKDLGDGLRDMLCIKIELARADLDLISRLAEMSTWIDDIEILTRVKKLLEERLKWLSR